MCGVFGIHAPGRDVARLSYFGIYALQHRGQESAGIAVSDGGRVTALRDLGLVAHRLRVDEVAVVAERDRARAPVLHERLRVRPL